MLGFQPPAISQEEIDAVAETLRSGWLTTGPRAAELGRRFAEYVQAERVLAVASGTAALHLALLAVGITSAGSTFSPWYTGTTIATVCSLLAVIEFEFIPPTRREAARLSRGLNTILPRLRRRGGRPIETGS
jgi:dTDP-4-amino-4,6-dideoxygalactose transaminase